jgi:hypothetical protein
MLQVKEKDLVDTIGRGVKTKICKVRGLLCHNCNKGLGNFRDNIEFLESAVSYLKSSN